MNNSVAALLFVAILIIGLGAGYVAGNLNSFGQKIQSVPQTATVSLPQQSASNVVNLDIIPDWGGGGYDAFLIPSSANGRGPPRSSNGTAQGPNDNNVTVPFGVPVTFVISNLDTAVLENYTGRASVAFVIYNNTDSGQTAVSYSQGQDVGTLPIGHTFSIPGLNLDIPIPPDTIVTFTYTFAAPGVYEYMCETPCGPGMGLVGYMNGYLIVR